MKKKEIKTGIYKHYKSNGTIFVIGVAEHSETKEIVVIYKGLQDNLLHTRPLEIFNDIVEFEGQQKPRFILQEEIPFAISPVSKTEKTK